MHRPETYKASHKTFQKILATLTQMQISHKSEQVTYIQQLKETCEKIICPEESLHNDLNNTLIGRCLKRCSKPMTVKVLHFPTKGSTESAHSHSLGLHSEMYIGLSIACS